MVPRLEDIPKIISNRKLFEETIYTPLSVALGELKERRKDKELEKKVLKILKNDIPEPFKKDPRAVIFRQVITPNYEIRRFVSIADALEDTKLLFWEYRHDKFTSNNDWKHSLGKLSFFQGRGKKGGMKIERINAIEFNEFVGKKISKVKTLWNQSLVGFHHGLFRKTYKLLRRDSFYDASKWFKNHGVTANEYYTPFLSLFIRNGVLFENFMLDHKEISFTREVFLPAFIEAYKTLGHKPLIIAFEPTDIEGEDFWMCHPNETKKLLEEKMG